MVDRPVPIRADALAWIRAMDPSAGEGGGSQPHMFQCDDNHHYLVKAANNPQGGRVLANETIGGLCIEWLGVSHPPIAIVTISDDLIAASPGAKFGAGQPIAAGKGFGSRYQQSEPQGAVGVDRIRNLNDVAGVVVVDTWVQNTDSRQYRLAKLSGTAPDYRFIPLDQGHSIAHSWTAVDLPGFCQNVNPAHPVAPITPEQIAPFVIRLRTFDAATANHIVSQLPDEWATADDRSALTSYLTTRAEKAATVLSHTYGIL